MAELDQVRASVVEEEVSLIAQERDVGIPRPPAEGGVMGLNALPAHAPTDAAVVTATIHANAERAEAWRAVFGADPVPLKSSLPGLADLPELGLREVYQVDVERLFSVQIDAVVAYLSKRWRLPPEEVRADLLGEHGLPVLAEDLTVVHGGVVCSFRGSP